MKIPPSPSPTGPIEHNKPSPLPVARPTSPANLVSRTPRAPGSEPVDPEDEHLQLPHERDEDADITDGEVDPVILQASKDLERGLVDTDMRATPGLDAQQRERDVPGAGGKVVRKDDLGHRRK